MIEWIQPRADAELKAKKEIESLRGALRRYPFWWIPGLPGLYLIYRVEPERLWFSVLGMGTMAIGLAWPLYACLREAEKIPRRPYQIGDRGVSIRGDRRFRWRQICSYRLVDHPSVSYLRCLEFKIALNRRQWWSWAFDPSEVNESAIRAILEEHLPGKCRDSMPADSA